MLYFQNHNTTYIKIQFDRHLIDHTRCRVHFIRKMCVYFSNSSNPHTLSSIRKNIRVFAYSGRKFLSQV
jgi:hypothetical protein